MENRFHRHKMDRRGWLVVWLIVIGLNVTLFSIGIWAENKRPVLRVDTIDCDSWIIDGDAMYMDPRCGFYGNGQKIDTTYVDTLRYYAKVDTVGWWLVCDADSVWVDDALMQCEYLSPTWKRFPTLTTNWHPKVQVWLTPNEYKNLKEIIK